MTLYPEDHRAVNFKTMGLVNGIAFRNEHCLTELKNFPFSHLFSLPPKLLSRLYSCEYVQCYRQGEILTNVRGVDGHLNTEGLTVKYVGKDPWTLISTFALNRPNIALTKIICHLVPCNLQVLKDLHILLSTAHHFRHLNAFHLSCSFPQSDNTAAECDSDRLGNDFRQLANAKAEASKLSDDSSWFKTLELSMQFNLRTRNRETMIKAVNRFYTTFANCFPNAQKDGNSLTHSFRGKHITFGLIRVVLNFKPSAGAEHDVIFPSDVKSCV